MSSLQVLSTIAFVLALAPRLAPERVGVVWHDEATVPVATQQRLADSIRTAYGLDEGQLLTHADLEAMRVESYSYGPKLVREASDLRARVDLVDAQFRAGNLSAAREQADLVLERLRGEPELPGAAMLARRVRVLRARVAWTEVDPAQTERELLALLALDPRARLSTRSVPPGVVSLFEQLRGELIGHSDTWRRPQIEGAAVDGSVVEIDGQLGIRPLPPGEHFIVLRTPGARPRAGLIQAGRVRLEPVRATFRRGAPTTFARAQALCERLELRDLVIARIHAEQVGLQRFVCGRGFVPPWFTKHLPQLVDFSAAPWSETRADYPRNELADDVNWPKPDPPPRTELAADEGTTRDLASPKKPWFRRAWVWAVVVGVVGSAVTTGAVLGTRTRDRAVTVGDDFLRPQDDA